MDKTYAIMTGSVIALVALIWALASGDGPPTPSGSTSTSAPSSASAGQSQSSRITLMCAASNRAVMDAIIGQYTEETGREVDVQYGPSQALLSAIEVSDHCDLFLPADDSYLTIAHQKQLIQEQLPLATMQGVVAVKRGNPKAIERFEDLFRPDVRFVMANPESAAIGKVTRLALQDSGLWQTVSRHCQGQRGTVTEVANDILIGAADAGIVYDAVLHTYPDLEFVRVPELEPTTSLVALGVMTRTPQPSAALHFARFVAASDRGLLQYRAHGFQSVQGDPWSDHPELNLFAGSMLRPAIEHAVAQFQRREGVRVNCVYNGCGILVGQMKSGQRPDAFFACDSEFMSQVSDLFSPPVNVSQNELVILVRKGNPHQIHSLADLSKPGLRVGVGHEKKCAMGWLTKNTLREGGVEQQVMENVELQAPTGDMLVNQMRAGSLDAAVAYLSNAAGSGDMLDAVRIEGLPCSVATQPWAVARSTPYRHLAARLFDHLTSASSKADFLAEGFRWQLDKP